jgi:hypothetical protein
MKDIIRMNQLAGIITEGQARKMMQVLIDSDQPYKIISEKTRKYYFGDEIYDEYEIEINKETHTTPDGSTFDIETIGSVTIPQGEELDFSNPTHRFYYIETEIFDENGYKNNSLLDSSTTFSSLFIGMVVYSTKTNLHEDKYCDVGNN